jgi:hypothetical protein
LARKILRILAIIIVSIVLINVLLFIIFSFPSVQKRVADFAIDKLKPKFGTELRLDGVRFKLFNTVVLNGLYAEDVKGDTLLYVETLAGRLKTFELMKNKLYVEKLGLENFVANVYRETTEEPFNFQFIIDAFAPKDTIKEEKPKNPLMIIGDNVILKNGSLRYEVLSADNTPGKFNASHLVVKDFNFKGNVRFNTINDLKARIELLSLNELNSGLFLREMKANIEGVDSLLSARGLNLSVNDSKLSVSEAHFNLSSKEFGAVAESDGFNTDDIAIFYSPLGKLDKKVTLKVDAGGVEKGINVNDLVLNVGEDTHLKMEGEVENISDFNNSNLNVDIKELITTQDDLETIISVWAEAFESPQQLKALGDMNLNMKAVGKLGLFSYDGVVDTEHGLVTLSGVGGIQNGIFFEGPVTVENVALAEILGEGIGVGDATMSSNVRLEIPKGENLPMTIYANGEIESVIYKNLPYKNINFDGTYSENNVVAKIGMDNTLNSFNLDGNIRFGNDMSFKLKGDIERLDLRPLFMMKNWVSPSLSASLDVDLEGATIDDLMGSVALEGTSIIDSTFIYIPGPIYVEAKEDSESGKKISLMSSFVEATVEGDYSFQTVASDIKGLLKDYLPSVIEEQGKSGREEYLAESKGYDLHNDFNFEILLKNTEDFSYTFGLPFYNIEEASIIGNVHLTDSEKVTLDAYLPRLMFGNNDIRETRLNAKADQSDMGLSLNSYIVQDDGLINAHLNSSVLTDSLVNKLNFDVSKSNISSDGELLVNVGLSRDFRDSLKTNIHILPTTIKFNNNNIQLNKSLVAFGDEQIVVSNFGVKEDEMLLLGIEGIASKKESDSVKVYFNNTELANILAFFNVLNISGSINGSVNVSQALDVPMILTDGLRVENVAVNNDTVGTLIVEGDLDRANLGININSYLDSEGFQSFSVKGFVPMGSESGKAMDVEVMTRNFELKTIQPFTTSIFSNLSGHLNSNVNISGSLSEPITEGWLGINDGEMKIAYSNVTYYISDTIRISRDNVGLKDLVIRDQNNNTATLNLSLHHSNFGRLIYNLQLKLDDFMLLNNSNRTDLMAYGNLKLTGNLNITGSPAGIYGDGNLTTASPSSVTVVLPQTANATEYNGVVYINTPQSDSLAFLRRSDDLALQLQDRTPKSAMPIVINTTVDLNDMFKAKLLMDPSTGNAIEASGDGEISINYNSKSTQQISLYGDYIIEDGKFHYNLQNLRTIDFSIREGSKVVMEGSPMNTQFNITAYLPVRADLAVLSPTFSAELANTRVPVNALLQIRGNLEQMELEYDIELPESSNDVQQRVNSFIRDEEAKILQFAYLATTGSFIPAEGSPDFAFGANSFTRVATSYLSRGLDALFAAALNDNWSVSTNLESVDGTFENVRMGVDVSTRLLDNRLRMNTNLSYGDNSMLASSMANNQAFMGEFELEYDINNWLMLRAFSRANEKFYSRSLTTQGIGIVVTKEAKKFKDLFRFQFIKPKEEEEEE